MVTKGSITYCYVFLWVFLIGIPKTTFSQNSFELSGKVIDSISLSGVDYALIYILDQKSGGHLSHAYTDSTGRYSIAFQSKEQLIEIHCTNLSYHKKVAILNLGDTTQSHEVDFQLIPKNKLDEVVINENAPRIIAKGDTLEFDSELYRDGTERNIEDVVRKLPGVEIDDRGSISFRGKKIDRVLIDGDDLQGSQYTVLTKNVTDKIVDRVQIIDNYVSNPLMQNIIKSDKTAVNIVIAEDFRNDISGRMEVGLGVGDDWKRIANINFISLFKKSKSLLIGNSNNIQRDAVSGAQFYMDEISGIGLGTQYLAANTDNLLNPSSQSSLDIPSPFLYTGNTHLGSLNHLMKLKPGLKLRISSLITSQDRAWQDENEITFFSSDQNFSFKDQNTSDHENSIRNLQVSGDYVSFKHAYSFNLFSEFSQQQSEGNYLIRRNEIINLQNQYNTSSHNAYHRMLFTKKTGYAAAFQFSAFYWDRDINEIFNSSNPLLIDYFYTNLAGINNYRQRLNQSEINKGLQGRIIISRKHNIVAETGYTDSEIRFEGRNCPEGNASMLNENCISGIEQPDRKTIHFSLTDKVTKGRSEWKISSAYIRKKINDTNSNVSAGFNLYKSTLDWKHEWKYDFYSKFTIAVDQDINANQYYYSHIYLANNQNLIQGINNFFKRTTFQMNASFVKVNDYKGYYLQYGIQLARTTGDLGSVSNFTNGLVINQFFRDRKSKELRTGIKVRYIVPQLKLSMDASSGYSIGSDQIKVEEEMQDIFTQAFSGKLRIGTAFSHINIQTDVTYQMDKLNYSGSLYDSNFSRESLDANIKLIVNLPKNIKVVSKVKRLQLSFDNISNNYYTLSHELLFTPANKPFDFTIILINPLNQNNYQSLFTSPAFLQNARTMAVDSFFIISFSSGL